MVRRGPPATWTRTRWTTAAVLGHDHPDTLNSAHNLAIDLRMLGDARAARDLDQDTLDRRRRVLGHNHPDTLKSASNLAADLHALGQARPPGTWTRTHWSAAAGSSARSPRHS